MTDLSYYTDNTYFWKENYEYEDWIDYLTYCGRRDQYSYNIVSYRILICSDCI